MPFPTKNEILVGIGFVFFGVIMAVCDRWQIQTNAWGRDRDGDRYHTFDHLFLMWTWKQLLQLCLLIVWKAIDRNWYGCGRFKHGEPIPRATPQGGVLDLPKYNDNPGFIDDVDDDDAVDGNGHTAFFQNRNLARHHAEDDQEEIEDGQAEMQNVLGGENGEMVHEKRKNKGPSIFLYLVPAFFAQADLLLVYFGLQLTYGSSFIMLKGTVTFFTALLAMAFLAQQLAGYVWFGVIVAGLGFAVSGINDYVHDSPDGFEKYGIAAGDLLIVMAQIMFASKIIYEEKFIRKYSIHPMIFLGCEALYGLCFALVFLVVCCLVNAPQYARLPDGYLEDISDAWLQFRNSWRIILAVIGSLVSYILYTYLGLFLVRDQGALPRIMIETFVWSIYWAVCLAFNWEKFFIAQVPGLCIIAIGALIYSHILVLPFSSRMEGLEGNVNDGFRDRLFPVDKPDKQAGAQRLEEGEPNRNFEPDEHDEAKEQAQQNEALLNDQIFVEVHPQGAENV